jgi:hypothetical protein
VDHSSIVPCSMIPKIVKRGDKLFLILLSKHVKNGDENPWPCTRKDNLYFINMLEDKIVCVIYNANLFLGF